MDANRGLLRKKARHELERLADLFKVLAEPRRLDILHLLMQREMCVCEILAEMGISQPLTSHHLRVLTKAGLIRPRRQAQRIFYSVVPEALAQLNASFAAYLGIDRLRPEAAYGTATASCPLLEAKQDELLGAA
jgi:ArsR family transcriptional regulator